MLLGTLWKVARLPRRLATKQKNPRNNKLQAASLETKIKGCGLCEILHMRVTCDVLASEGLSGGLI
jgi:hypothetical protein